MNRIMTTRLRLIRWNRCEERYLITQWITINILVEIFQMYKSVILVEIYNPSILKDRFLAGYCIDGYG